MSLRYILGVSGSGKTTKCLHEIITENNNENKNSLIYIVPEQFSLESEKNLILLSKEKAIIRCQVLSFQRLAFHLFSELGLSSAKLLEDNGKNMLLRKIVSNLSKELNYFSKAIDKQGFMENLSGTITEFYRYQISVLGLENYLDKISDKENLKLKVEDLYKIYKSYVDFINKEYISTDETLDILSEKIPESDYLKDAVIWIDGFNGFTPQEYSVIKNMLKKVKQVNITFTVKEPSFSFEKLSIYDPFFETKNAINKISKIATENGISVDKFVFLNKSLRFGEETELSFLEKNYFNFNSIQYEGDSQNISIFKAANSYKEIKQIATKIHELVSTKNYRYKEIAVLTASLNTYEKIVKGIFKTYEIPCFFDTKSDILSHPLTEFIRALVDIVVHNFNYEAVFRLLKTNLTSIKQSEIDILENYVLAYGIKGYKWNMNVWKFGFNDKNELYDEEIIHKTKNEFLEMLKPFTHKITHSSKLSIKEICKRIYNTLLNANVTQTLSNWIENFEDKNSIILRQHNQIWGKISTVFEKMVDILGEEIVTISEFAKILDAGLLEVDMGIIPPTQDSLIVGDLERTRLPEIKAMFVLGVNEGILPKSIEEIGLFSDDERIFLSSLGMELAPDSRRKTFEEQFLIYSMITKPLDILQFSYSIGTLSGKSLQPSSVIAKIKKLFPKIIEFEEDENLLNVSNINLPGPMFNEMGKVLRKYSLGEDIQPLYLDMYNWFNSNDFYKEKLDVMENILFSNKNQPKLEKNIIKKLYGKELMTSVSRLEKFVNCPYSYFVEYNLNAKERKIYDVASVDLGNLFHMVIELFSKRLVEKNLTYRDITREQLNLLVEECVDFLAPTIGEEVLLSTSRLQYAIRRIKRISKRSIWAISEHIKAGLFEQLGDEIEFSFDSPLTSIIIEVNDKQKMILTGRIDRVDFFDVENSKYIKVIDYKSGNKKFDLSDIYYGMQLQLLLYLDTFIKNSDKLFGKNTNVQVESGGVFYFNINDPMLEYTGEIVAERIEELLLKEFKMSGLVLSDKTVVKALDQNIDGDSNIIPVSIKKKDNEFGARSCIATKEEFLLLQDFVQNKIKSLGEEIFGGNISVFPYKKGLQTGCDYCKFLGICQFEILDTKNRFNVMKKFNSQKEALEVIVSESENCELENLGLEIPE